MIQNTFIETRSNLTLGVDRQRNATIKPGTFLTQMKLNNPTVDTIIQLGLVVMVLFCQTNSTDSLGLCHNLTAAFVTKLEEGLSIALGYNDTLHAIIIH